MLFASSAIEGGHVELEDGSDQEAVVVGVENPTYEILARGAQDCGPEEVRVLAREIVALGSDTLPLILDCLEHGKLPSGLAFTPGQVRVLRAGLIGFPKATLLDSLKQKSKLGVREEFCIGALGLLSEMGDGRDMAFVVALAESQREPLPTQVARALQETTANIYRRDPRSLSSAQAGVLRARLDVGHSLVNGIGELNDPLALQLLTSALGLSPGLDLVLITQAGTCAERTFLGAPTEAHSVVREFLWDDNLQVLRESAMALGRMGDMDSVPRLIELLGHEKRGVQEAAYWSLGRITGLRLRQSSARWRSWYKAEERWLAERASENLAGLESEDLNEALQCLTDLARHKIDREANAQEIERLLGDPEPSLRLAACSTLGRLGSKACLPSLVAVMDDSEASVRSAALAALREISGRDHGAQASQWKLALAGE